MELIDQVMALAKEAGFETVAVMDAGTIELKEEVRAMCAEDKCKVYGHNWTCPPACGDLDYCRSVVGRFKEGVIFETVGELEDSLDYEGMMDAGKLHRERLTDFAVKVKEICPEAVCLGAGGCTVCKTCNYPEPCRFPDKAFSSMEAYGMVVSEVCTANQVPYYHGQNTITYVGCCLVD